MANTVFCRKYQQELPALTMPPLPGAKGQEIQASVSQQAWNEWQALQTRLINEKHLNLLDPATRRYLMEQLELFLDNQPTDTAQGYVPPSE
ncbi:oxidative damage protection protein [Halotalea alkalilenta]|uniref:Probable Fe(2+)-trafficking protein n=1 Tax=Halotalea alkalilenta TaxID=376489 RepID=A0A172YAS6_9GAMM|nr:oxidative damage protection protein [Halotalea alkalilenta]ANF56115.1 oxidative damage protection protein [Halotalea alkalilenta]